MKLRFYISLIIARLLYAFLRITKLSSGTAILGLITLKICPEFLNFVAPYIKETKINITGTNGKTTTSGIITHLLKESKKSVINNTSGANMLNGIVNSLVLQVNPFKKAEVSVIETDEAFLEKVYSKMSSDYLLVTNLFEDQTDRFATPFVTKSLIQKGIDKQENLQLILNADEPISAGLVSKKDNIYFGFENVYDAKGNTVECECVEMQCPACGKKLNYSKIFYSQVGHYNCECGYERLAVKYLANVTLYKTYSEISLGTEVYKIPLLGLYNAYNALGAIALAKEMGVDNIQEKLSTFKVAFGRSEKRNLFGHETIIHLIKNPAGTNEVLKAVNTESNILVAVNNNEADGTDISWINQANFEVLSKTNNDIVVTGICAAEMEERLKKAGVSATKIIPDIKEAVKYIGKNAENEITILTTYTALLKIDKLKEMKKCY